MSKLKKILNDVFGLEDIPCDEKKGIPQIKEEPLEQKDTAKKAEPEDKRFDIMSKPPVRYTKNENGDIIEVLEPDWIKRHPIYIPPIKKDAIVLVVENLDKVREYSEQILRIVSKIFEDNKDSFFSVYRIGDDYKHFGFELYDYYKNIELNTNIFSTPIEPVQGEEKLYITLRDIFNMLKQDKTDFYKKEIDNKKYEIMSYRMIFIGTANFETSDLKICSELLKDIKLNERVKSIKYFCINDKDTLNAAKVGFPLIGHIESNFYK